MRINTMNGLIRNSIILASKRIQGRDYGVLVNRDTQRALIYTYLSQNGLVLNIKNSKKDRRLLHCILKSAEFIAFDGVSFLNAFNYVDTRMKSAGINLNIQKI